MERNAITIDSLRKSFGDLHILRDLSLTVGEGEVYGLLGPSGAGKSTLVHLLLGFMRPSAGWIDLFGTSDLEEARGRIGYLPERARYHTRYAVREYLRFLGSFDNLGGAMLNERIETVLQRVGLLQEADLQLATFSRGMLQRLGVAQALLTDPDLLILDEPFTGLDPAAQGEMLELLADLRVDRRTILITTPYFPALEQICDRIGVLARGRVVVEADAVELRQPANSVCITVDRLSPTLASQLHQIGPSVVCGERDIVLRPNSQPLQAAVMRTLLDADAAIISLLPQERPLERLYLQAVRGEPRDPHDAVAPIEIPPPPPIQAQTVGADGTPSKPAAEPAASPPAASPPVTMSPPPPLQELHRAGEGDTLLRELLRRDRGSNDAS